jgi:hypothetical protein
MKIEKFNENNREDYDNFVNKVKSLFLELWDDKLGISSFKIDTNVRFNLSFNISMSITSDNFVEYNELCNVLNDSDSRFQLISGVMYASITDFNKLIDNIKLLLNSRKFNV